jgi:F0F1-type ATP synthase assembly protein I
LKEQFAANWGEKMPEEALQQALDGFDTAGSLLQTLKSSLISGVFLGLIIGSITAAVMKREPKSGFLR